MGLLRDVVTEFTLKKSDIIASCDYLSNIRDKFWTEINKFGPYNIQCFSGM